MEQITTSLPRSAWENIIISENNEEVVEIQETDKIVFSDYIKQNPEAKCVRKTIREKIIKVSESLPEEYKLFIIEGYRSVSSQQKCWDRMWQKVKTAWPELSDEEIEKKVRLYVARPAPLANHNCGGAIDVTLIHKDGTRVNMGTLHPSEEESAEAIKRFPMFSSEITEDQKINRKILRDAMVAQGFVWYPGEWWHYCWGDRMWAVYTKQKECFYGPISN